MSAAASQALDALKSRAQDADAQERRLRQNLADELARLEKDRRGAYRRYAFLKALIEADARAGDREASRAAQARAAAEELEWDEIDAARAPVLEALMPLFDLVHDARKPTQVASAGEAPMPPDGEALLAAFTAFEAWYEGARGKRFVELFERYVPETPLVDF